MKVLLIQPYIDPRVTFQGFMRGPSLALELIAGNLAGYDVDILDLRCGGDLEETLISYQPDVVGVTSLTTEVHAALELLQRVKNMNPEIVTVAGGIHATLMPQDFQQAEVDVIVIGEGEISFRELIQSLEKGANLSFVPGILYRHEGQWINNAPRPMIQDLDSLPFPNRSLTKKYASQYFMYTITPVEAMLTTRGCPFHCIFCSQWKLYNRKCRYYSADRILDELKTIDETNILLYDDNFLLNPRRVEKLCDLLRAEGIHKSFFTQGRADMIARHPKIIEKFKSVGLEEIAIGFESPRQADLDHLRKKSTREHNDEALKVLNDHEINTLAAFMVHPSYDVEDFERLASFIEEAQIAYPFVKIFPRITILTPLPGTDLYELRRDDLITNDYRLFDTLHAVLPTRLPREEFYRQYARVWKRCLSSIFKKIIQQESRTKEHGNDVDSWDFHKLILQSKQLSNVESYLKDEEMCGVYEKRTS